MTGEGAIAYWAQEQWLGPVLELRRLSYRWLGHGEPSMDLEVGFHLIPLAQWLLRGRGRSTPSGPINALHLRVEAMDHLTLSGRIRAPWGGWSGFSAEIRVSIDDEGYLELEGTRAHLPDPLNLPGPVPSLWPISLLTRRFPGHSLERLGPHRVRVPLMDCIQAVFRENGLEFPTLPETFGAELVFHRTRLGLTLSTGKPKDGGVQRPEGSPRDSRALREALAEVPEFSESIQAEDGRRILMDRIDHALAFGHWNEAAEAWQRLKSGEPDLLFGVGGADVKRRWLWLAEATDLIPEALHRVRQLVYAPDVGLEALGALSRHHRRQDAPIRAMLYLRQAWDSIGEVMPASLARWAVGQSLISCLERIRSPEASRVRPELEQIEALLRSEQKTYARHRPPPCVIEAEELGPVPGQVGPSSGFSEVPSSPVVSPMPVAPVATPPPPRAKGVVDDTPQRSSGASQGPAPEAPQVPRPALEPVVEEKEGIPSREEATLEAPGPQGGESKGADTLLPTASEEEDEEDAPTEEDIRAFRQVLGEAASLYGIVMDPEQLGSLGPTPEEGGEESRDPKPSDVSADSGAGAPGDGTPRTLSELKERAEGAGEWGAYLQALEEALSEAGEAQVPEFLRDLSEAYITMAMPSRAEGTLGELLSLGPQCLHFEWAARTLKGIYEDGGRLREVMGLELTLIGHRYPGASGLVYLRALADDARRQDLGDVESDILRRILQEDPSDDISLERLDSLLKARGAWLELAQVWGERGGEQGSLRQAEAYVEAGALDKARSLLEALIDNHPDKAEAKRRLETILHLQGEGVGQGEPRSMGLDQIEAQLDRLESTGLPPEDHIAQALEQHLEAHPRDRRGIHALIRLHGLKGTLEDAVVLLEGLSQDVSQGGAMRAHWLRELGDVYLVHLGDPDKALAFYERADALGDG